ncbi:molybdenum cofactor guanylyltransferase [Olivibacter sp. SDN3]|uniref:molybdenum cofactor guanylyltransferase n=1 Tax=Olivibacter sp. SDN3 TaxID=2764720 RepID=UPI001650F503|nr:molybdenum cofactor guanylyltransferase [Olivibacter sp. SDN3]QNL47996.1 molybdenum cofactor guanylyltransferase [Olivibacter sp. SDN3]
MIGDQTVEAFVLAGGKSTRMGVDKGLVVLKGKPMISYILETLQRARLNVSIVANNDAYKDFGLPVYADVVLEKGPMGGLLTAMRNAASEVILLISCDMPLISPEAINSLLSFLDKEKIVATAIENKVNPLFALYPRKLKSNVEAYVISGRLKMTDFILDNPHLLLLSFAQEMSWCFKNVNTPIDLEEIMNSRPLEND